MSTRFKAPTMDEVQFHAAKIGLPISQAEQFYCYYASKGWKVGKHSMTHWRIALTGWKLRWEQARADDAPTIPFRPSSSVRIVMWHDELKKVEAKMKSIRDSYAEHQSWSEQDYQVYTKLKARKVELKKLLGMQV